MIHYVLHFITELFASCIHVSSVNYICVVHKNVAHKVNGGKREGTSKVKAESHCFHHFNDDSAESNVGGRATTVALSNGLEWDFMVFPVHLRGISVGGPDFE
jgi:hypothetical protein